MPRQGVPARDRSEGPSEVSSDPFRECQVCGAFAALEFCAACGCAQEDEDGE